MYPKIVVTLVILDVVHLPVPSSTNQLVLQIQKHKNKIKLCLPLHIAQPIVKLLSVVDSSREGKQGSISEKQQVLPDFSSLRSKRLNFIENEVLRENNTISFCDYSNLCVKLP